jgi:hypothetical protein
MTTSLIECVFFYLFDFWSGAGFAARELAVPQTRIAEDETYLSVHEDRTGDRNPKQPA